MNVSYEIIFLMVSLIVLGMTFHAKSLYEGSRETRPSQVLMATFVLANLGGASAMAYAMVSPVFLTFLNTLVLASACCGVLTARSWRMPLSALLTRSVVVGFVCIALAFELLRQYGSYLDRIVFHGVLTVLFLCWLVYEALNGPGFQGGWLA
jgi:hypothetical protein